MYGYLPLVPCGRVAHIPLHTEPNLFAGASCRTRVVGNGCHSSTIPGLRKDVSNPCLQKCSQNHRTTTHLFPQMPRMRNIWGTRCAECAVQFGQDTVCDDHYYALQCAKSKACRVLEGAIHIHSQCRVM